MPCYRPLKAYRAHTRNASGKRSIVVVRRDAYVDFPIELPCSQCIGCRLERSRQWAIRCVHEASLYENNCFITLTYSSENLPPYSSLLVSDFQKFMKRLRKKHENKVIRFFHCGEYGEQTKRPHYHACLFNFDFSDKVLWKVVNDQPYFVSEELRELWPKGHSTIGDVTFESAAYVARYITKKVTGAQAEAHYEVFDPSTGEYVDRKPEYTTMSRRPGIGKGWFEKFKGDVYPHGFVVMRGKKMRPPKFYDSQFEIVDPQGFAQLKADRQVAGESHAENNTPRRLLDREEIKLIQLDQLKRSYENNES